MTWYTIKIELLNISRDKIKINIKVLMQSRQIIRYIKSIFLSLSYNKLK